MDKQRKSLPRLIVGWIKSRELKELAGPVAEVFLDKEMSDGLLKDIPLIGTALKLYSMGETISDALFLNKLRQFLFALNAVDQDVREKFVESMSGDEKKQSQLGEAVMELIDKADGAEKAHYLGQLMAAYICGDIPTYRIFRLCHMVNRSFVGDLAYLRKFEEGTPEDAAESDAADSLVNTGFLSVTAIDEGNIDVPDSARTTYKRNAFGNEFAKFTSPPP